MTFLEQQAKLREFILEAYNRQQGTSLVPSEWSVLYDRVIPGTILSVTLFTEASRKQTRIRFIVKEVGKQNNISAFEQKLKPNFPAGSLQDEVFEATGTVKVADFPDVFNYLNSEEFKKYNSTPRRIATQSGKTLTLMSGHPIETQR